MDPQSRFKLLSLSLASLSFQTSRTSAGQNPVPKKGVASGGLATMKR